jgi:sodium transport system permease protein
VKGAFLVFKKEFLELSKDRKTLFFTFLMPLILYPVLFGMIGMMSKRDAKSREGRPSRVLLVDPAGVVAPLLRQDARNFQLVSRPEGDLRQAIRDQKLEMALEVDADAAARLKEAKTFTLRATYDQSEDASKLALDRLQKTLKQQDTAWVQARLQALGASPELAVPSKVEKVNAGDMGLMLGKMLGSFLPYMLMIMMFAGAMQHGIYATAGEKERGTLLSLLSTSLPRSQIILGKLLYVFAVGLISALVNLLAMALSMGRLVVGTAPAASQGSAAAGAASSGLGGLAALADPMVVGLTFLLMIPLGLLFANVIVLGGIQAKNTVEAGTALTPGIFVVVVLGVFSLGPGIEKMGFLTYVPVLNVSLAIRKMFSQQPYALEYAVSFAMTVLMAAGMTWVSARFLRRESVIFRS